MKLRRLTAWFLMAVYGLFGMVIPVVAEEEIPLSFIMHAGGGTPDGIIVSNSLEALDYTYQQGYRVIEMDFCWTIDLEMVCVHDWDLYGEDSKGELITADEFERLRGTTFGYTSMTLNHLAEWVEAHPDVWIVTDIKEMPLAGAYRIAQRYPELQERFIIQIYDYDEYELVQDMGFENIILTLYRMSISRIEDIEEMLTFVREHSLLGLTFPESWAFDQEHSPLNIMAMMDEGIPLLVHTVNEPAMQQQLFDMGITGIYTDFGNMCGMTDD